MKPDAELLKFLKQYWSSPEKLQQSAQKSEPVLNFVLEGQRASNYDLQMSVNRTDD